MIRRTHRRSDSQILHHINPEQLIHLNPSKQPTNNPITKLINASSQKAKHKTIQLDHLHIIPQPLHHQSPNTHSSQKLLHSNLNTIPEEKSSPIPKSKTAIQKCNNKNQITLELERSGPSKLSAKTTSDQNHKSFKIPHLPKRRKQNRLLTPSHKNTKFEFLMAYLTSFNYQTKNIM